MTYSVDFRAQVIKSAEQQGISIRQACTFYDISKATLQNWLKDPSIKLTRNKPPRKIPNEVLLKDVEQYPYDYLYERAKRFGCSKSGIEAALKRLSISQKKELRASKILSDKKSNISE
ncbi:IS630 transposase-related protein [Psychrobacter vallis]|uniref:IS630 transposase-related protein n=1 Tax=Psychrobacter vallis TaxID=248451 RepID=UPI0019197340|nr:IS630 transposase-related protein [Psychrobacter vallis]